MLEYEDPATWRPEPVRPRGQLVLRFPATVAYLPVPCLLAPASWAFLLAVGLVAEVIAAFSDSERWFDRFTDRVLDRTTRLPSWCVTWPELRHEGDTGYYRARVDKRVADWTRRASRPVVPKKPRPPVECAIPLRDYRGAGGRYVAEVALAQGWELRPTDVGKEVRLWWTAATKVDRINTA
ncbi:hypothetical protein ACWGI9_09520 [Streptomyces sp. NPDC054833]